MGTRRRTPGRKGIPASGQGGRSFFLRRVWVASDYREPDRRDEPPK